jgi:hypothetical protein
MQFSPNRLATFVCPGYSHSGKKDRDYGETVPPSKTKKRVMRNMKKKMRRLLNQLD